MITTKYRIAKKATENKIMLALSTFPHYPLLSRYGI